MENKINDPEFKLLPGLLLIDDEIVSDLPVVYKDGLGISREATVTVYADQGRKFVLAYIATVKEDELDDFMERTTISINTEPKKPKNIAPILPLVPRLPNVFSPSIKWGMPGITPIAIAGRSILSHGVLRGNADTKVSYNAYDAPACEPPPFTHTSKGVDDLVVKDILGEDEA